ncbi:hypothetical protein C2G38_2176991 [Gigaspora rosea]|uniref:Uncharacterized protein n=1 Tax=Gigaspora rosea TaxID=44941 RepID=A0A397VFP7_9GLOM|nr:hypothetical protein C2G38_2176991 [Gigaspora rosea]
MITQLWKEFTNDLETRMMKLEEQTIINMEELNKIWNCLKNEINTLYAALQIINGIIHTLKNTNGSKDTNYLNKDIKKINELVKTHIQEINDNSLQNERLTETIRMLKIYQRVIWKARQLENNIEHKDII